MSSLSAFFAPARAMDRTGLLVLLSSLYFLQVWGLTTNGSAYPPVVHYALVILSAAGILLPRFTLIMVVNFAAFVVLFAINSPIASNNQTTAFFTGLIVLWGWLSTRGSDGEAFFRAVAGPGRFILAGMYFYGIYHKINVDFLDVAVSCAVELYKPLAAPFGLDNWRFGQYGAIWATFIVEGIAMTALFVPRLKWLGFAIGVPFHVIIGFTGYAYYKDFSTIVLVLYALFLPAAGVRAAVDRLTEFLPSAADAGRAALVAFVAIYALTQFLTGRGFAPGVYAFMPFFAVYTVAFYAFCLLAVASVVPSSERLRPGIVLIIPIIFFLNGFAPYVGLRTEGTIAMYSNLHVEGGQTNHLIHGVVPFGADYSRDLVRPIALILPDGTQQPAAPGDRALVRFEFDRLMSRAPGFGAVVEVDGKEMQVTDDWQNTHDQAGWMARKYLIFKPVDFGRPKVCTH